MWPFHQRRVRSSRSPTPHSGTSASIKRQATTSASSNATRIVLGRGYSNGQLTYTIPISVGGQNLSVQMDTGSADFWLAGNDCKTTSCKGQQGASVTRFNQDVDGIYPLDADFSIDYLVGGASGPIYTGDVHIGSADPSNVTISSQAFGVANDVNAEDLDVGKFSGVMGLGLPANSLIQNTLNTTVEEGVANSGVDPSMTGSVLGGIWQAESQGRRFMGIGMQRLEEEGGKGDSVLTFGMHDPSYAGTDLSLIKFSPVVPDADDVARQWRVYLTQLTVSLNGNTTDQIPLGFSGVASDSAYPLALLDTAASINLGPTNVLNALYGAWGIGPGTDGGYYVPCDLQMNITVTLGGVSIPIHPLDASLNSGSGTGQSIGGGYDCLGSFQALKSPSTSSSSISDASQLPADFILSNSFLRSAYTVLTCDAIVTDPLPNVGGPCKPQVGLRPLVNMTKASDEFHQVRILKQTLGKSSLNGQDESNVHQKALSGGVKIVIGCVSALVVILIIFGLVLWGVRRQRRRLALQDADLAGPGIGDEKGLRAGGYQGAEDAGTVMPMRTLSKDAQNRPSSDALGASGLSATQRAKARKLQQIHGVFDDELMLEEDEAERTKSGEPIAGPRPMWDDDRYGPFKDPSNNDGNSSLWDISSTGYVDARRVKNEYLGRLPDREREAFLQRNQDHDNDQAQSPSLEQQVEGRPDEDPEPSHPRGPARERHGSNTPLLL
ncbi:acid protease [Violaceomyces palustris]|uniref:Acid protease n=1 Tax=Violaceomyces palustris TaxID=1673888 RepID=A0ACD0P6I1_9BASI|nr:acid protease [Violaceomyces palustris]